MKFPTDVVSAMSHPAIFGPMFAGPSWDGWKSVLKGAFGLRAQMSPAEVEFFRSVTGRDPPAKPVKELVVISARRTGKDSVASVIACHTAITFRPDGRVRPGERPLIMLLGADRSQARNLLNYVRGYFSEIPALKALIERETQDGLELRNGIDIVVQTNDYRSARSRSVLLCIGTETAFWNSETSSSPDIETFRAIKPSLVTLDGMTILISSAYRRAGLLYDRWAKYYGTDDPNVLVVRATAPQLNPTISMDVIEAAIKDDPEAAKSEWLSEWRDDLASYITRQEMEAALDTGITIRAPQTGTAYSAFVDASSGAGKDSFCASIGHRGAGDLCIIDAVIEIKPPFSPPDAVAQIAGTLKRYGLTRVLADRWGLNFVSMEFERHGVSLDYSDKTSSEIFRQALPVIRSGRARLVDNDRMINQFTNLERRILPGGSERIGHPERGGGGGHHDDVAVVVAGCLVALSTPLSGPEGWLAFYQALSEGRRYGSSEIDPIHLDRDPIRAGDGRGWEFHKPDDWVTVIVPPGPMTADGQMDINGSVRCFRRAGNDTVVEVLRNEARVIFTTKNRIWREHNADLVKELGLTEETAS